ncbi:MFS transporter [Trinickia dinghuensis]|uniref:MFS transporter n=1 Tax=Trinickia dinghuensis TaxID=2291023 RepID=A0A3D8K4F3_9BURK|nr:MFS transporter [Trinickia dinghuensis]RDV00348.1 MFS transporter [Trinickia dinghuensis]
MMRAGYENKLLAILSLSFGFVFFDRLALSFLFPFISNELHLTNAHLGMLSSVLSLTWALSGATLGAWSDKRASRKPVLIVAVIAFSVLSSLSGFVTGFLSLLLFRALMGIAEGPVLPVSQSLLAEASTPARRGLNMGIVNGSAPGLLGAVLGPPVLIWLATTHGWRTAFLVSIVPGIVIAALIALYVKDSRTNNNRDAARTTHERAHTDWAALLKNRNVVLCVLIACCYLTWFVIIVSFAPTFLVQYHHFPAQTMGYIMSMLGFAWVGWSFIVPAISDRIGRKPAMVIFSAIAAVCPILMIYVPDAGTMAPLVLVTYTGLGCFTLFMATIPAESTDPRAIATALGLIMGVGELTGGFLSPTIAGFAADHYGMPVVMWIASAGAIVPAFLSVFLRETAPARVGTANVRSMAGVE